MFKERQLYKEFVPILINLQNCYQVRDMRRAGEDVLEAYLAQLFVFTMDSYAVQSESINFHASKLNHLW